MEHILGFWIWISADGIVAFITAAGLLYTIRNFNKQQKLMVFMDYTKRYQEILLNLPLNIYDSDFCIDKLDVHEEEKTLRYLRSYFDLCSEEYHLYLQKHISKETWKEWESGIKLVLEKTAFRTAWERLNVDSYYEEFAGFVDKATATNKSKVDNNNIQSEVVA
ncbi:hypothetical protein Q4602_03400 [Paraglaciecola chathamensis]|uniref:hypothetical protein n=1 Tax=Paraglaciecola chathamensis TaxID=368405 RepID=UPI002709EDEE|nr:hypothetical protein [Paraglaciecola chathamensis]MDO6838506.1 hypothetical protein [Paraglaciecola chathamensis]